MGEGKMSAYELKPLNLPILSGRGLRVFAAALDNPVTRPLLLGRLMREGGMGKLQAIRLDEPPTVHPFRPPEQSAGSPDYPPLTLEQVVDDVGQQEERKSGFNTVVDYARAYRSGEVTPMEVAERVLEAVAASDARKPSLRAFIRNDREDVMAQAGAASDRMRSGTPLSILDGVPVAVKDEFDQMGYGTTVGTGFFGQRGATEDSTVVARLRAAGALLIGKANMNEIGINPDGFNLHHGTIRNPYNLEHDPGGSSGGSAAAVAAGFCPVAVGADGGGSIRIPSSHCGVVGLKATYGRISEYGAAPLCWSVAHAGPIGASVADVALAYAVMAGPDAKDAFSLRQPAATLAGWNNAELGGIKLGVYWPWFNDASPSIVQACVAMLEKLVDADAHLLEINIPQLDEMRLAHAVTFLSEIAASMENLKVNWGDFSAPVRINMAMGRSLGASDYIQAQRMRTRAISIFDAAFSEVDVIITPAVAITAPPLPEAGLESGWSNLNVVTELMRYMFPGNLTGLPAISFPVGYDEAGLPIGMQAMGRHWEEHILMQVAYAAEQVVERKRPTMYADILA
jgi:Asp-tRNA(Asn)/Glu-tRNA(Gln) amidotransferase A subunit family amidase